MAKPSGRAESDRATNRFSFGSNRHFATERIGKVDPMRSQAIRGYSIIEVMIAIALLAVASSGIVALHKVSTFGHIRAKNLLQASQIGRLWVERLRTDAASWNYPSPVYPGVAPNINQTAWLQNVVGNPNAWFRPVEVAGRGSAAFDALGNNVPESQLVNATFCTHLRLAWMYPNSLLRADVRIFWLREAGAGPIAGQTFCSAASDPNVFLPTFSTISPLNRFHAIYFSTSILQNAAR